MLHFTIVVVEDHLQYFRIHRGLFETSPISLDYYLRQLNFNYLTFWNRPCFTDLLVFVGFGYLLNFEKASESCSLMMGSMHRKPFSSH